MTARRHATVANATRGVLLAKQCRVARTLSERMIGLLLTPETKLGDGLLIRGTQSIHMFFMRYPIDVVFIDRAGRVTKTVANLRPWRAVWWAAGARDCLELPVGRIGATGTSVGDQLTIEPAQGG